MMITSWVKDTAPKMRANAAVGSSREQPAHALDQLFLVEGLL